MNRIETPKASIPMKPHGILIGGLIGLIGQRRCQFGIVIVEYASMGMRPYDSVGVGKNHRDSPNPIIIASWKCAVEHAGRRPKSGYKFSKLIKAGDDFDIDVQTIP